VTDVAVNTPGAIQPTRAARAGALMAASTLAMAAASALQAVLYLGEYGATARTDAFFAAFALYQVVGVFTQTMRLSSVPLLIGKKAIGALGFFGALAVIAVPLVIVCGPLASPMANLLAPSAHGSAHTLAMDALRILGVAMVLQMMAAGAATLLGLRDRFEPVAAAYASGALTGLIVFLLVRTSGELSLGWSMLAMAIVTSAWMMVSLWRVRVAEVAAGTGGPGFGGDDQLSEMLRGWTRSAGNLLGRSIVYFVINAFFLITLAEVGRRRRKHVHAAVVDPHRFVGGRVVVLDHPLAADDDHLADLARRRGALKRRGAELEESRGLVEDMTEAWRSMSPMRYLPWEMLKPR